MAHRHLRLPAAQRLFLPSTRQPAYTRTDLSLSLQSPNDRWSLQGFVSNMADEAIWLADGANTGTAEQGLIVRLPRMLGLRARINPGTEPREF